MFRFLTLLFLTVHVLDLAIAALETGRVWVMGDIVLKRKRSPIRYWLMTFVWSLLAVGGVVGVVFLSYLALTSSGPYKEHAFFSFHQAWPYAVTALLFGSLAVMIIRDRLLRLRHREHAA